MLRKMLREGADFQWAVAVNRDGCAELVAE